MDDAYPLELRRQRAIAQLDMYAGLLKTLAARVAYARELVAAAGMDWDEWRAIPLDRIEEREVVLARGRKALQRAGLHP